MADVTKLNGYNIKDSTARSEIAAKARTFVQAGEPTGANDGDFWIDLDETPEDFLPEGSIQLSSVSGLIAAIAAAKPASYTGTLTVAGWNNNVQTLSNAFFLTGNYRYIVAPNPVNHTAYGEAQIYAEDVNTNGQMVFHCSDVPSDSLSVYITREAMQ